MQRFNRILITGGAGFIGSALIRKLLKDYSCYIYNLDKLTYASDLNSINTLVKTLGPKASKRYKFFQVDISSRELLDNVINQIKPELIIHVAAETHVDKSIKYPENFIYSNVVGTFQLLQSSLDYYQRIGSDTQNKFKFIHISSDEVFGSLSKEGYFNEKSPYNPTSPYSASKASSDHLVKAWFHTYGLPTIITNCSNNYGPWQYPEKLIPNTIAKALLKKDIPVYGNGNNIRDWLYVEDHVEAILLAADKGNPGKSYCIGGNNEKTNLEIVNKICNYMDILLPQINKYKDFIKLVSDRPGHDFRYAINSSLVKEELKWVPKHNFDEALLETINWYLDNKEWLFKK